MLLNPTQNKSEHSSAHNANSRPNIERLLTFDLGDRGELFKLGSNLHFVNDFVLFEVVVDHGGHRTIGPDVQRRFDHVNHGIEGKNDTISMMGTFMLASKLADKKKHPIGTPALPTAAKVEIKTQAASIKGVISAPAFCIK